MSTSAVRAGRSRSHAMGGVANGTSKVAAGRISVVGWTPQGDLQPQEWIAAGRRMGTISRCSQWWIGDWIRYGTRKWGEKYVQASRITGYDVASLRNIAWVSAQFDVSLRSDKLSWSHHALLAPLEAEEKVFWLERASTERLSVADLRTELRAWQAGDGGAESPPEEPPENGRDTLICPKCGHELEVPSDGGR
jgi:hypothetical protein